MNNTRSAIRVLGTHLGSRSADEIGSKHMVRDTNLAPPIFDAANASPIQARLDLEEENLLTGNELEGVEKNW